MSEPQRHPVFRSLEDAREWLERTFGRRFDRGTMTVTAVVHRADGTTEDLGAIASGRIELPPVQTNDDPTKE
jgi:hypothetical protein